MLAARLLPLTRPPLCPTACPARPQCSKFHPLSEFEGEKLSCRAGLERHTQRRKERQARQRQALLQRGGAVAAVVAAGSKRGAGSDGSDTLRTLSSSPCSSSRATQSWERRARARLGSAELLPLPTPLPSAPFAQMSAAHSLSALTAFSQLPSTPLPAAAQQAWTPLASLFDLPPLPQPPLDPSLLLLSNAAAAQRCPTPPPMPLPLREGQVDAEAEEETDGASEASCKASPAAANQASAGNSAGQPCTPDRVAPTSSTSTATVSLARQSSDDRSPQHPPSATDSRQRSTPAMALAALAAAPLPDLSDLATLAVPGHDALAALPSLMAAQQQSLATAEQQQQQQQQSPAALLPLLQGAVALLQGVLQIAKVRRAKAKAARSGSQGGQADQLHTLVYTHFGPEPLAHLPSPLPSPPPPCSPPWLRSTLPTTGPAPAQPRTRLPRPRPRPLPAWLAWPALPRLQPAPRHLTWQPWQA